MKETDLFEKLRKIERLYAGATTPGEKEAAADAMARIRQRRNTVMVRVPRTFVDETLWPEFLELSAVLQTYLDEVTERVITRAIHEDDGEEEEIIAGDFLG